MLHITNGSAIIPPMREAGIAGRIVPWDDVLHEGPVPAGLNLAALRDVRVEFLATWGGPSHDEIARSFGERDSTVADLRGVDEVVLWFEHDLYDQLQLIQVLDRLAPDHAPPVTSVPGDHYLGDQPATQFAGLLAARTAVTSAQRVAARDAWDAFRSSDPRAIVEALPRVTALPHLAPALMRHLQQFPAVENGLSRTEQQTLEAIARGATRVKEIYVAANHDREEAVFMGDAAFVFHITAMLQRPRPLIRVTAHAGSGLKPAPSSRRPVMALDDDIGLTDDGQRVLDGQADRVVLCGIDRWLGGVHLTGHGPVWRYDPVRKTLRLA